ncbi:MAG: (Fe-S)-binding protein [Thermodesulfobacteriota bacterium]
MKKLAELITDLDRCVKCGTCRSGCPTFNSVFKEGASARGRLAVMRARADGTLEPSDYFKTFLKDCTLCGACTAVCPNDVDTPALVLAARVETVAAEGLPFASTLLMRNILESSTLGKVAVKTASRLQGLLLKGGGGTDDRGALGGLISRFQLPLIGGGRLVPELAGEFFLDRAHVKALSGKGRGRGRKEGTVRVGFFAGCGINYLLPEVGEAALKALGSTVDDLEIVVPQGQVCCGMPALSHGDIETARNLAIKNLVLLESYDFDFITTACATCSYGLTNIFDKVLGDEPEYAGRIKKVTEKVRDITTLLAKDLTVPSSEERSSKTVTYHDPCHLSRGLDERDAPRELIEKSGHEFLEMGHPCRCCGFGGGLSFTNYELSTEINLIKAKNIVKSGADIVATACPGCIVQLKDGLNRLEADVEVKHVLELF